MERDELVRALRCQASVDAECRDDCPYFSREKIPEELQEVFSGKLDWLNCDCNRCVLDAADLIEAQAREIDDLQKQLILRNDELLKLRKQVPQWVSVTERLPSDEKPVLAYYGFDSNGSGYLGMMFVGVLSYFCFDPKPHWQHEASNLVVTHWMPLPEAPKEDA